MQLYGLIGYPLSHSFSAAFFADKFRREGIAAEYRNFPIPTTEHIEELVASLPELRGFNVTIPHKQSILSHLTSLSDEAREIGAVNVVRIRRTPDGAPPRLEGFNTDVLGFTRSLRPLLGSHHRRALVLGTGGASRAVVYGLRSLGITPQLVSRTPRPDTITYAELTPETMAAHPLIVNCTPVGMHPHTDEAPPLPYEHLTPRHLLYDLIYNPTVTAFLARGEQYGAATKNGLEMLHLQAIAAWDIWNG